MKLEIVAKDMHLNAELVAFIEELLDTWLEQQTATIDTLRVILKNDGDAPSRGFKSCKVVVCIRGELPQVFSEHHYHLPTAISGALSRAKSETIEHWDAADPFAIAPQTAPISYAHTAPLVPRLW